MKINDFFKSVILTVVGLLLIYLLLTNVSDKIDIIYRLVFSSSLMIWLSILWIFRPQYKAKRIQEPDMLQTPGNLLQDVSKDRFENTNTINEIENNELSTGKRYNEIALGFKLRMTNNEYLSIYEQVQKDEKIIENRYKLFDSNFSLHPEFIDDKLFVLEFRSRHFHVYLDNNIVESYKMKYGEPSLISNKFNITKIYFIDGNRKILIEDNSIKYIDIELERLNELNLKTKENKDFTKHVSEI